MIQLRGLEENAIKEAMGYPNGRGYVVDLSDRTIVEFFKDEFGINFDDEKYKQKGSSKCNRLLAFIGIEPPHLSAKVLRSLWDRREGLIRKSGAVLNQAEEEKIKFDFFKIINKIEEHPEVIKMDALHSFEKNRTLDELIIDIGRDLEAKKPEAAIDHLHTYCMKKFGHLLKTRGIACNENEPLNSRLGKYRCELKKERTITKFTDIALKQAIELFETFNDIRNNHSFAHDNPILEPAEARYIFETVNAVLIFLRSVEAGRYDT